MVRGHQMTIGSAAVVRDQLLKLHGAEFRLQQQQASAATAKEGELGKQVRKLRADLSIEQEVSSQSSLRLNARILEEHAFSTVLNAGAKGFWAL